MENYLKQKISIVNKNNIINISIGNIISDNIFDKRLSYDHIVVFLKNLSKKYSLKNISSNYHKRVYKYKNNIIEVKNNIKNYYTYQEDFNNFRYNDKLDINISFKKLISNSNGPISVHKYNLIEDIDVIMIDLSNITIEIQKFKTYFTICLSIKKPSSYKTILDKIVYILSLIK